MIVNSLKIRFQMSCMMVTRTITVMIFLKIIRNNVMYSREWIYFPNMFLLFCRFFLRCFELVPLLLASVCYFAIRCFLVKGGFPFMLVVGNCKVLLLSRLLTSIYYPGKILFNLLYLIVVSSFFLDVLVIVVSCLLLS